jgi:hypothetical protein
MVSKFKIGKHEGEIIKEFSDWDEYSVIFNCLTCKKAHIFSKKLVSSTSQLLQGEYEFSLSIKDYNKGGC